MKPLSRRSIIAGSAAAVAAIPALALPVAATEGDDAELRCLWEEWVKTWTELQAACEEEHRLRGAIHEEKKRLPKVYWLERVTPAHARARRRWVAVEHLHALSPAPRDASVWRRRPIPGSMSYSDAYDAAKARASAEVEEHRRRCDEIRAWHGLEVWEAKAEALRGRLKELRGAIKTMPATTIFGVGVRLVVVSHSQWEDDHREMFFSTLETVEKLSGTQFKLPELRV